MKMFKKISFLILLNFIPLLVYAGPYTFEAPVSDWKLDDKDTYGTYTEDNSHKCTTHPDSELCKKEGLGSDGKILRNCSYNGMCSAYGFHHTGIDYDKSIHHHILDNEESADQIYHYKVDDILAANDGKVVRITENGDSDHGLGNSVIIEHRCNDTLCPSGKIYSLYGHLYKIKVKLNDPVSKGEVIGYIGGTANGKKHEWITHLHFEFKTENRLDSPECIKSNGHKAYGYTDKDASLCGYRDPTDYFGKIDVIPPSTSSASKSSYFDGAGSLIKPDGNCFGCQHDAADMQRHDIPSTVVFQWKSEGTMCSSLKIGVKGYYSWVAGNEPLDVIIHTKNWSKDKSTAYKATLPLTVDSEGLWNITAVTSQEKLSKTTRIIAECEKYMSLGGNKSPINEDMVDLSGNYLWAGNGSVITSAADGQITGRTQDWAIRLDSNKAIAAFQWEASENCASLQLETGHWNNNKWVKDGEVPVSQVDMKDWDAENWPDNHLCQGKLPCDIYAPTSDYHIVKIKTKGGGAIPSKYIHASCK